MDATRLELLLEIETEGNCHLVLVDFGASLSVMKPVISSSELQPTLLGVVTSSTQKATPT